MELQKFDRINNGGLLDKVIVINGKRETGKTFLVQDILRHLPEEVSGTVIASEEDARWIASLKPDVSIHHEYNVAILENILKAQKREMNKRNQYDLSVRHIVTMDNCLYNDLLWHRDKIIHFMFKSGRHWKITLLVTMTYPLGMPPILRDEVDYVFILRENYIANRKRLYENYAGMFPTFEAFCQAMDTYTNQMEYGCIVIDTRANQAFWYKATE
jgi:hypothetical protein